MMRSFTLHGMAILLFQISLLSNIPAQTLKKAPPLAGCDTTFLKIYGSPQSDETGSSIAPVPAALGGGYLLGGGKGDSAMLTLLNPAGDIVWTRAFDATPDAADFISDIKFDSDNNVIGAGRTKVLGNNIECFAFKYNMAANTMLWINELDLNDPALELYYSMVEKTPGGNYVVAGEYDQLQGGVGCNGILLELDRNTGAHLWQRHYTLGSCETFQRTLVHDGAIYTTGRYNFDGGGTARMRPGITKFDLLGNQLWSRLYLKGVTPNVNARLYPLDMIVDDGLAVLGWGDNNGSSTTNVSIFLYHTDLDGILDWAMEYNIPGANSERATRLISLPDGYLCLGYYTAANQDVFLFKTDKQGNLLWSKSYGGPGPEDAQDLIWDNGLIYFLGTSNGIGAGGSDDIFFASLQADGSPTAQADCNLFADLPMTSTPYPNPYDNQHNLTSLNNNWSFFINGATLSETALQATTACFSPCVDSCDLLPDAVFEQAAASCSGNDFLLSLSVCNAGNALLPAGTPVTFYDGNPTTSAAGVVATFNLPAGVVAGDCNTFDFVVPALANTAYFIMVNDDGTTPTPFDTGTFTADVAECDYSNNLGFFILPFNPPSLGPDLEICEGGSFTFNVPGFSSYEWSPDTYLSCTDCPGPTATPVSTITYTLTATSTNGCVSNDSILITVFPAFEVTDTIKICQGDTALVFGNPVDTAGVFTQTLTTADGCDSMLTVVVKVLQNFEFIEDVQICEGDTVLVFGVPVFETGEFSQVFTAQNGCDSTHTISVGVLDTVVTHEEILRCWGDSVIVFGEVTYFDGTYEMTFTGANGCDSTHIITVTGHPKIFLLPQKIHVTCFGGSDGAANANVVAGGLAELTYLWNTGQTTSIITGLSAGTYSVTVTDGLCPEEAEFIIEQPDEIVLTSMVVNEGCDEPGSASVTATGGTGGITFEWSTGDTGTAISGLAAGMYSVIATDANGCTGGVSFEITGSPGVEVDVMVVAQVSTAAPNGGALAAQVTGGTPPFSFDWDNGETTASLTGLGSGTYTVTVTDDNGCTAEATAYLFVPACAGGKIWNDTDRDGCQDGGEFGMANIGMTLTGTDIWGNPVAATTTTAINGEYIFENLPPGTYQVGLAAPAGFNISPANACPDDFTDSDFTQNGMTTGNIVLVEGHCCLTVDGGLFDACLNLTTVGEICCGQTLCGPGNDPAPITSVTPAGGGGGATQYMWMYARASGGGWQGIPSATGPAYDPGPLSETTYFVRCAKSATCTSWLESNIVTVTVDDVAVAAITPPGPICVGVPVTFTAAPNGPSAVYAWNFGPWAVPSTSNQPSVTVTFSLAGYTNISLSVTQNSCTSTDVEFIGISNSPVYCSSAIAAPGGNLNGATVPLQWETGTAGNERFSVFPNPVGGRLTVSWQEEVPSGVEMEILGVEGRVLLTGRSGQGDRQMWADVSAFRPGVYLLRLRSEGGQVVLKLIKS